MSTLSVISQHEYYAELGDSLPPPVLNQPEYRERRLITAVEAFNDLRPGDSYEGRLAVQIVLCGAHAADSLREAGVYREDFPKMTRCRAQAASMMREERAAKRLLAQEQKVRLAVAVVAGSTSAQPAVAGAQPPSAELRVAPPPPVPATHAALPPVEATTAAPLADQATAAVPPPAVVPSAVAQRRPAATRAAPPLAQATSAPPPSREAIEKAEAYALDNVMAAAQIRHDRGVTPRNQAYFHQMNLTLPADPTVIDALVRGTSDLLTALGEVGGEQLDAAA